MAHHDLEHIPAAGQHLGPVARLLADTSTRREANPSLDGLRGIAVLFVLLSHLSNAKLDLLPWLSFSGIGKVGVWLFFVLSAFLLSSQFLILDNHALARPRVWWRYFLRRILRIYPLFIVVMLVSFVLRDSGWFPPLAAPESFGDLYRRLTLSDAKGVEWSVLVEFRFYFLLPLIIITIAWLRCRTPWLTYTTLAAGIVAASLLAPPPTFIHMTPYLVIFLFGVLSAYAYQHLAPWSARAPSWMRVTAEFIAVAAFGSIALLTPSVYGMIVGHTVPIDHFHTSLTLFGALWALFLLAYLCGTGWIARFLSTAPLRFVGIISFSLYFWHPPVIKVVADHWSLPTPLGALLVLALTTAVATLTYLFVERPFLRMRIPG